MQLYSTRNPAHRVDLATAIQHGLAPDQGLYHPVHLPRLSADFWRDLPQRTFPEVAYQVARTLLQGAIPNTELRAIIEKSMNFPAPLHSLDAHTDILELFHGPSMAFKDFGARFMAATMAYYNRHQSQPLTILVATSGDTGGAVATGFHRVPGIEVVILYPSGKVSPLQEQQLTTLGHNITAIEVAGTFDDCQRMVKAAFMDSELGRKRRLSSANSINIARLIPQTFYYFEAFRRMAVRSAAQGQPTPSRIIWSVPSGNFGNLTAGLIAQRMGLPVSRWLAATNVNDTVPRYLRTGQYEPQAAIPTLANAMDVGAPSNFERMQALFGQDARAMQRYLTGYAYPDDAIADCIGATFAERQYLLDPHTAVGLLAWRDYQRIDPTAHGIVLATAHYAKFAPVMEPIVGALPPLPPQLATLHGRHKQAIAMPAEEQALVAWLRG